MGSKRDEEVDDEATELYNEIDLEDAPPIPAPRKRKRRKMPGMLDLDVDLGSELEDDDEIDFDLPEPEGETESAAWGQLHPASVVVNLVPRTLRTLWSFWPILLIAVLGGSVDGGFNLMDFAWLGLFAFSGVGSTLIHYLTLRYRVHNGKLEIKQGLLNRQARTIDPARIQNVGLVQNPFHRMSGLVEVRVETAGDVRTEGLLSALSNADAKRLMAQLAALRGQQEVDEIAATPLIRNGLGELLGYGLSKASAGYVAVLLFAAMEIFPLVSPEKTAQTIDNLQPGFLAGMVLLAFAISWMASAALAVVRHYGFSLFREQDGDEPRLRSQEGLLTRKRVQIPVRKVQLVLADEPLMRRWMGFGTLSVETAGLGSLQEGVTAAELVVPMVEHDELGSAVRLAIPKNTVDPWRSALKPAAGRALYRLMLAGLWRAVLVCIPVTLFFWPLGAASLALLPLALLAAWLDWRYQGWLVTPDAIISRRGFWRRRTWVLARSKLQSVHLVQGPVMRLHGLGRLVVRVAGSQVVLPDLGWAQAERLLEGLRPAHSPPIIEYKR